MYMWRNTLTCLLACKSVLNTSITKQTNSAEVQPTTTQHAWKKFCTTCECMTALPLSCGGGGAGCFTVLHYQNTHTSKRVATRNYYPFSSGLAFSVSSSSSSSSSGSSCGLFWHFETWFGLIFGLTLKKNEEAGVDAFYSCDWCSQPGPREATDWLERLHLHWQKKLEQSLLPVVIHFASLTGHKNNLAQSIYNVNYCVSVNEPRMCGTLVMLKSLKHHNVAKLKTGSHRQCKPNMTTNPWEKSGTIFSKLTHPPSSPFFFPLPCLQLRLPTSSFSILQRLFRSLFKDLSRSFSLFLTLYFIPLVSDQKRHIFSKINRNQPCIWQTLPLMHFWMTSSLFHVLSLPISAD
jgi:hypothetical protein